MPRVLPLLALLVFLPLVAACDDLGPSAPQEHPAAEGGTPLAECAMTVSFPWMGKQSVMCVGDSVERQIAFVDFTSETNEANESNMLGTVAIDEKGVGTGSFSVAAKALRSGHVDRDTKLMGGAWLDAETHPTLGLEIKRMTRVKPTVWKVEGAWTMRGVTHDVTFQVNARSVGEMKWVGDDVVRITGRFDVDLKQYGMDNGSVGTSAVAQIWTIDVGLLGVIQKK
ncbi:MAG: YceI family protein [Planctomycetota bacterium]